MKNKRLILIGSFFIALCLPLVQGCSTPTTNPQVVSAMADKPFSDWFDRLLSQIKSDRQYQRIPIETTEKSEEFIILLHDTYRHKVTKAEFTQQMKSQYPGHDYEISFITSRLP
ncbi:TPA: hypothetical protein ACOQZT_003212 [Serratia odorifera]|uniref:hypothetical protein n=1 Tax=Serratia odorifera TaxID=618 RepID=UPI0023600A5A|nr:hypothetical protein [Serratia odorifera]HEJ9096986.1 hypothetical protein [Serratia odorifera]